MGIHKEFDDDYYYYHVSTAVSLVSSLFFINFIITYFYSSFIFSFSSKPLVSTDTLHSIQESRNSSQIEGQMNIHQVRPMANTMIWFNDWSPDLRTTFDLSGKSEFRDPCTPGSRLISTWNALFPWLQSNLPPVCPFLSPLPLLHL